MTKLSVPSYRTVEDGLGRSYTVFVIEIHHVGRLHRIEKRYRAFHTLHKQLKKEVSTPEFPPKRVRNWNSRVIEHRRQGLEHYLQTLLAFRPIPKSVVAFLEIHGLLCEDEDQNGQIACEVPTNCATTHQPIVTFVSDPFCSTKNLGCRANLRRRLSLLRHRHLHGQLVRAGNGERTRCISATEARQMFLDFFVKDKSHSYVPSSSVIAAADDPSLLFTNAGMNQFKSILLGGVQLDNGRQGQMLRTAVNSQKCVRVGGKHNDLDDVGRDGHHHTFFEMLGSWSFGQYFKEEACRMAWELLTGPFRIPPRRLFVTYFGGDQIAGLEADEECRDIWLKIGLARDHILPFGSKDNFWEMGNTGPCGPCTEIHYSHVEVDGNDDLIAASHLVNAGRPDVIEVWNLVFVQYNRLADGTLRKLSKFHVDTGMGLERLGAVLCRSRSNYDTDLFRPIFDAIHKESGCRPYKGRFAADDNDHIDTAYRVVADHARMCAVTVADGLVPDEYGAGHRLRRVIRRAGVASRMNLNATDGLLGKLLPHVATSLGDVFPEVHKNLHKSVEVVCEEEEKFLKLLDKGLTLFQRMCSEQNLKDVFTAENMWSLFFVHGFPEELILDLCATRRLTPDIEGFKSKLLDEKAKSASAYRSHLSRSRSEIGFNFDQMATERLKTIAIPFTDDTFKYSASFCGNVLKVPSLESRIVAIWDGEKCNNRADKLHTTIGIILDRTNFYPVAGGQMCDTGFIESKDGLFKVDKVEALNGYIVHRGTLLEGCLLVGSDAVLKVDETRRSGCTRNHTAVHILHAALRNVLGPDTCQKSSMVSPDYLRFDFSVKAPLKRDQFERIESFVRKAIEGNFSVRRRHLSSKDAFQLPNLVTLTGATYPDPLTVVVVVNNSSSDEVDVPPDDVVSIEPCCGTHVTDAGCLMDFVILSQKSLSQTCRSIRAVTAEEARKARNLAERIKNEVAQLELVVSDIESGCNENFDVHQELGILRTMAAEDDIPLLCRAPLDDRINSLKRRTTKAIRKRVRSELRPILDSDPVSTHLVHAFGFGGNDSVVFDEVSKLSPNLATCVFVVTSGGMNCQCRVPKDMATDTFNAGTWAAAVTSVLGGVERKPATKVNIVSQIYGGQVQNATSAQDAAIEFVRTRLKLSS